jgi:hypothetical protein
MRELGEIGQWPMVHAAFLLPLVSSQAGVGQWESTYQWPLEAALPIFPDYP